MIQGFQGDADSSCIFWVVTQCSDVVSY